MAHVFLPSLVVTGFGIFLVTEFFLGHASVVLGICSMIGFALEVNLMHASGRGGTTCVVEKFAWILGTVSVTWTAPCYVGSARGVRLKLARDGEHVCEVGELVV